MNVRLYIPFTEAQAKACVIAADGLGVEPWEMAVHVLEWKRMWRLVDERKASRGR